MARGEDPKNYVESAKDKALDRVKQELDNLKQSFEKVKNDPQNMQGKTNKLDEISNIIQESGLDSADKEQFVDALDNLKKSIEGSDVNSENLKTELDKVTELLESLIRKELMSLKQGISKSKMEWNHKIWKRYRVRPDYVQEEINNSSENIPRLIEAAKDDKSWFIRNVIARLLEWANS